MKTIRTTTYERDAGGQLIAEKVVTEEIPVGDFLRIDGLTDERHAGRGRAVRHVDREQMIVAIDELHELAWGRGEMGHGASRRAADALAAALGWDGEPGSTPDGHWLRDALAAELSR